MIELTDSICLAPPLSIKIFALEKRVLNAVPTPTTFKLVGETVIVPAALVATF
jgi:hypothetical protein